MTKNIRAINEVLKRFCNYAYTTVCIDTMYRMFRSIWIYQTDADTDLAASKGFF